MLKHICVLGLLGSGIYLCGMEDLPGYLGIVAKRETRLTASTGERFDQAGVLRVSMDGSDFPAADSAITEMSEIRVDLGDREDLGSSDEQEVITEMGGVAVDLGELEDLGDSDEQDIIEVVTPYLFDRSVCISPEERMQFLMDVLKKYEAKKSDDYRKLTRSIRSKRSVRSVQLNVDLSTIHSGTTYIARKLLEKEHSALGTKLLTAEEQRKAAEKTETRVKIVSAVASVMVCAAVVLPQILSSVL